MAVRVLATLQTHPGRGDELLALWPDLSTKVKAEGPCLEYALWRDTAAPDAYVVWELWESAEGLKEHGRSPHMRAFGAAAAQLLTGPPVVRLIEEVG